jgi:hypothetical protein
VANGGIEVAHSLALALGILSSGPSTSFEHPRSKHFLEDRDDRDRDDSRLVLNVCRMGFRIRSDALTSCGQRENSSYASADVVGGDFQHASQISDAFPAIPKPALKPLDPLLGKLVVSAAGESYDP